MTATQFANNKWKNMNIALLGYGKMGHAIEALAENRGHRIGVTIDNETQWRERLAEFARCDMAIDFSQPSTAIDNIHRCFDSNMPLVIGTTGWYDRLDAIAEECRQRGQALFMASNFSIGMNVMFELNRRLAYLMEHRNDYRVTITETHHIHKLDAPSGTAITLAGDILAHSDQYDSWHLAGTTAADEAGSLPVAAIREGEVAGIHTVTYDSDIDTLTLTHSAKSRKGLALGALMAAEYLLGRKGYYTMHDMLAAEK